MSVDVSIYASQVVWNGNTWNAGGGGPLEVSYQKSATPVEDRTGDDLYPRFVRAVDAGLRVTVRLRDLDAADSLEVNDESAMTVTYSSGDGEKTKTFANLVLMEIDGSQGRATQGDLVLTFRHRSDDGQANPIS